MSILSYIGEGGSHVEDIALAPLVVLLRSDEGVGGGRLIISRDDGRNTIGWSGYVLGVVLTTGALQDGAADDQVT